MTALSTKTTLGHRRIGARKRLKARTKAEDLSQ
jgi:hypothetical protein